MKKEFSKHWKESKQPRKQRKYVAKAPLNIKKKLVNVNLSKELRTKHEKRTIGVRTGDVVKILRGKYKGKKGKIMKVYLKISKVIIDGIKVKKLDGSEVNVKMQPSNLQIVELHSEDRKRKLKKKETKKEDKTNKEKK
ncbi:50S ribosomal protein L24 [Candidatus Pacearchaeota archaeon]|nr:50S ribosomal protein L24 [Candidatus Pacearchaeota archaeon]